MNKRGTRALTSYKNNFVKSKHSQITIYIIIAIVILSVLIFFLFPKIKTIFVAQTPSLKLKGCFDEKLKEAISIVSKNGGSINPVNAIMYKGDRIEYLCYTNQYYKTCVMQQPLLKQHIEREILDYIKTDAKSCIEEIKNNLKKQGYEISSESQDFSVSIIPEKIRITIPGMEISKQETSEKYGDFEFDYNSKFYDLIMLTTSILNWEARFGDSDITTYMIYYPYIKVEKYKQSDGSKIYILTHTTFGDKFSFATRSLSWPAGYGLQETYKPV
ncbi:MAG: hypothetical protein KJ559_01390 [Nanoarchaeota archaeon]|nr:hypothetical protein [Nanoarchaeota archaeon]